MYCCQKKKTKTPSNTQSLPPTVGNIRLPTSRIERCKNLVSRCPNTALRRVFPVPLASGSPLGSSDPSIICFRSIAHPRSSPLFLAWMTVYTHPVLNSSVPIDDPQAPPRIQQHPHKRRLHPAQLFRAAIRRAIPSHRSRQRRHRRHPVTHSTRRVPTCCRSTPHATALIGRVASRARAILARRLPTQECRFLARTADSGALRPRNVVLVQGQLPPIHPRAEAEVASHDEEKARQHAADDGADVGA